LLHQAQLLAYMRMLKLPVGLLLNFNGETLRSGVRRLAI
jgi:iron complex transport system substrate-binding protein